MRWVLLMALFTAGLAGCLGDADDDVYISRGGAAVHEAATFEDVQPDTVTGLEFVAQLTDAEGTPTRHSGGIWAVGDFVFGSDLAQGFWVADISNPADPVLIYNTTGEGITSFGRDADVLLHPDGRASLVIATQNDGMHIWDVTNPAEPEFLARTVFEDDAGNPISNHNVAVVPGTELVFNSRSSGEGGTNDLVDLSRPSDPIVLGTYGTHGCHDIAYFGAFGDDKFRAYCPGIDRTEIWSLDGLDVSAAEFGISLVGIVDGPLLPVPGNDIINTVGYPLRTLHHLAIVNNDASILIIGDEHNGGGQPGMCLAYDGTVQPISTPLGALWFYDISDEANPEFLSWISPPTELVAPNPDPSNTNPLNPLGLLNVLPSCTAHFGQVIPGEEKLVMSWYNAGVVLIDFTDPAVPEILDQYTTDDEFVWDARVHNGYVFTGDIVRGMDILKLV